MRKPVIATVGLVILTALFFPTSQATSGLANLDVEAQWSDGTHCNCSLTILIKGVNGLPDHMIFDQQNSSGHITGTVALDPAQSYEVTLFSHDLNVPLEDFILTSSFLTSNPLAKLNLNLRFSKPTSTSPPVIAPGSQFTVGI